ncbi:hypothetical protein NST33_18250 [Paenibacillus sp. FSL L8-0435]|uniref:hypothetical protein n=1 Tax=Paenibacillus sp. FSL L8-0435 TaxID=2954618 RepID=UPI0030D9EC84
MLERLKSTDEVEEYFKNTYEYELGKVHRVQLYDSAYNHEQQKMKEKEIEKQVDSKFRRITKTVIISDSLAVVEAISVFNDNTEICYYPVVEGKYHNESFMSFDEALLAAITRKYTHGTQFTHAIYNMLRMDLKASE